ncbi:MAG: VCBS repeat-containing protein [Deltaproteobacteria bacterium]|nr:VCBS repeat-containing protein [Deltaproteobacteria bacterium]
MRCPRNRVNSISGVSTGVTVQASYQYVLTDITGDGLPDLVGLFGLTTQMVTVQNTSSGGTVSFGTPYYFNSSFATGNKYQTLSAASGHPSANRYLDFNGDGRNDIFLETNTWTQIGPGEYDYRTGVDPFRWTGCRLSSELSSSRYSSILPAGQSAAEGGRSSAFFMSCEKAAA